MKTFNSWLWPDRTISKAESRQLRDEHNAAVNEIATLRAALAVARATVELHANQCAEWSARMARDFNAEESEAYRKDEINARKLAAQLAA